MWLLLAKGVDQAFASPKELETLTLSPGGWKRNASAQINRLPAVHFWSRFLSACFARYIPCVQSALRFARFCLSTNESWCDMA